MLNMYELTAEIKYQKSLVEQMTIINNQVNNEVADLKAKLELVTEGRNHYAKQLEELKKNFDNLVELLSIRCENLNENGKTILDFQAVWIRQEKDINSKLREEVAVLKEDIACFEAMKEGVEVRIGDLTENNIKLQAEVTDLKEVLFNTRDALLHEGIGRDKLQDEVTFLKAEVKLLELYLKNTREDKEKLRTEVAALKKDYADSCSESESILPEIKELRDELKVCEYFKKKYYNEAVEGWQKFRESERKVNIMIPEREQMKDKLAQVRSYLMGGMWTNNLSPDEFIKHVLGDDIKNEKQIQSCECKAPRNNEKKI